MAIAHDADSTSGSQTGVSSFNWNHTVGSGSNMAMIISLAYGTAGIASITVAGSNATFVTLSSAGGTNVAVFVITGLSAGVNNIVVTSNAGNWDPMFATATTFSGVNQTYPIDANPFDGSTHGTGASITGGTDTGDNLVWSRNRIWLYTAAQMTSTAATIKPDDPNVTVVTTNSTGISSSFGYRGPLGVGNGQPVFESWNSSGVTTNLSMFVVPIAPAITFLQSVSNEYTSNTTYITQLGSMIQQDSCIVVAVVTTNGNTINTPTDNNSNGYILCGQGTGNSALATMLGDTNASSMKVALYFTPKINTFPNSHLTVTANVTYSSGMVWVAAHEYSGLDPFFPQDGISNNTTGTATSLDSNSVTTKQNCELVFGLLLAAGTQFASISSGSGFTQREIDTSGTLGHIGIMTEDKFVHAIGSNNATGTVSAPITNCLAMVVTLADLKIPQQNFTPLQIGALVI